MATPEGVIQKINLLIEDANDATGSLHNNLRDAVDSLILGYGGYGNIEVDSLSELHTWSKYAIGGTVTETKVDTLGISGDRSGTDSIYEPVDYADEYDISNGKIVLVNPTENLTFTSSTDAQVLLGKYIQTYEIPHEYATAASPSGKFYRIDSTAKVEYSKSVYPTTARSLTASPAYRLEYTGAEDRFVGIVVSDDIDAYPQNGEQDGYKYVYNGTIDDTASVPVLQSKSVTPSAENQLVLPDTNYDGLSHVTVAGDADLVASNIKKGVEIFGVTGSYEATGGIALPTLTNPGSAADLAKTKQLIDADGNIVTGSVATYDNYSGWGNRTPIQQDEKIRFEQSSGVPMLFRNGFYLESPLSNFGDATAEDVVAGKTFTSAEGLNVTGTHKCTGGGDGYEVDSLSELHAWSKYTTANGSVVETQLTDHVIAVASNRMVDYADTYSIVNGEISLDNPSSVDMFGAFAEDSVKGKHIYSHYQNAYYYVPADAIFAHGSDSNGSTIKATKVTLLTYRGATGTTEEFVSIVVSDDINAYPQNGERDGYKYVYNGTLDGSGGGFTVTDDGAGNVTITSSSITDNDGNVVIA